VNRARLGITVSLLSGIAIAFVLVPIPWHVDSPFLLQPKNVRQVYVATPGFVAEVKVEPEQRVKAGDVLAVLSNPELEGRLREADMQIRKETARLKAMRAINERAEVETSQQRLISLSTERDELLRQMEDLIITSPCDGTVIPPERLGEKPKSTTPDSLAKWHGTPLEDRNRDTWLPTQTLLLAIAPDDRMEAILVIDQGDRESLRANQTVEIRLDHLPDRVFPSRITQISPRSLEFAPEPLSNKYGGPLPTTTDSEGRQKLTSVAYQATALLDEDTGLLKTGAIGQARVLVDERSAASWTWKWLRQTFYCRL
jgi:putative peptide zinc metalloprotease protein